MGLSRSSQTSQSDFPVFCGWSNQTLLVRIKMSQGDYHWYILNLYISAHTEFRYEIRVDDEISSSTTLSWPAMKRLRPGVYFNDDIIEIATQWVLACIFLGLFQLNIFKSVLEKIMWSKSCLEWPGSPLEQFLFFQDKRVRYAAWLSIKYWSMKIAKSGKVCRHGSHQKSCRRSIG